MGSSVGPTGPQGPGSTRAPKRPLPPRGSGQTRNQDQDDQSDGLPELFSPEFFDQLNKGPMEQGFEARNRDPRNWNRVPWRLVVVGLIVGLLFAVVNVYAALTIGIVVGVSWYLVFFIGALLGWTPGRINYVGGASNGTSQIVIPIAFVLPALFLLTTDVDVFGLGGFYSLDAIPSVWALIGFFVIGGLLGVLFFLGYRYLWIVRRPLQYPGGFEAASELLRLARERATGATARVREHVFVITTAALASAFWVFIRDLRAFGPVVRPDGTTHYVGFLDTVFRGRWYHEGIIPELWANRPFYNGLVYLDPFILAIGWFLRWKVALVLVLGALVTFLLPFFDPGAWDAAFPEDPGSGLAIAWTQNARLLGAAAIVGAGLVAFVRLRGHIVDGVRALMAGYGSPGVEAQQRQSGPTWRERGGIMVPVLLALALVAGIVFLVLGGVPVLGALLVVPLAIILVGLLGFIAVKITGETAIQPLSPMITIGFLALLLLLNLVGFATGPLLILALGAAAFFGAGVIMSTDVFLDTKVGHYIGNPPHRQALMQAIGLVPGVIVGTLVTWFLADMVASEIARGEAPSLSMPFAYLFSGISFLVLGGDIPWMLIIIAFLLGASVEYGTRLGTVFAIGMVLQLFIPMTILAGALVREGYERLAAPPTTGPGSEKALLMRVAMPTGLFVGGAIATLVVFLLNQSLQ